MTDIVDVPAAPVVAPFPALGSNTYNDEAYAAGLSLPGLSAGLHAIAVATRTNALAGQGLVIAANTSAADAAQARDEALAAAVAAATSANFVGAWSGLTGPLAKGANVYYAPQNWQLLEDVADVAAHVPGVSAVWVPALQLKTIGGVSLVGTGDLDIGGDVTATTVQRVFSAGEQRMIALDSPIAGAALVSVQREIPQLGVSTNAWQSALASGDFVFENHAPAVAITIGAAVNGVAPITLASGAWTAADVGRRIEAAGGVAVIQSCAGAVAQAVVVTAFAAGAAAAGTWALFGLSVQDGRLRLGTKAGRSDVMEEATYVRTSPAATGGAFSLSISDDGQYLFCGAHSTYTRYTLTTPWNVSNWSAQTVLVGLSIPSYGAIRLVKGGERLWGLLATTTSVWVFENLLSTPNGTAHTPGTGSGEKVVSGGDLATVKGFAVTPDGLYIYTIRSVSGVISIQRWTLGTAWNLATMSASPTQTLSPVPGVVSILDISADATVLYLASSTNAKAIALRMPTANNLAAAVLDGSDFTVPSYPAAPVTGYRLADGGRRAYAQNGSVIFQYDISGTTIPVNVTYPAIHASSIDTEFWTDARDLAVVGDEGTAHYAVSTDGRVTWCVSSRPDGLRIIARLNAGAWEINTNAAYTGTTWANAATNTEHGALRQAVTDVAVNRMNKTQLVAGCSWNLPSLDMGSLVSNAALANTSVSFNAANGNLVYAGDGSRFWTFDSTAESSSAAIRIKEWTPAAIWGVTQTGAATAYTLGSTTRADTSPWAENYFRPFWSDNGLHLFVAKCALNTTAAVDVVRYTTSTPWRAAGLNLTPNQMLPNASLVALGAGAAFNAPGAFCIAAGGTRMYLSDNTDRIHQFLMPTPYSLIGMTYGGSFVFSSALSSTMRMTPDGRTAFVTTGTDAASIRTLELSTPFDITTAVLTSTTATGLTATSFDFGQAGSYFYALHPKNTLANALLRRVSSPLGSSLPLPVLGDQLDIAVMLSSTSVYAPANTQGLSLTYDANTTFENLLPGTHYTYTQPSDEKVLFKSLTAGNLKVRIA